MTMAANDSMGREPSASTSHSTKKTHNSEFDLTAEPFGRSRPDALHNEASPSREGPEVILRGQTFTLLRGDEMRMRATSPSPDPISERCSGQVEPRWPASAFGSWRREFGSYFFGGASSGTGSRASRLFVRTDDGFSEAGAEEVVADALQLVTRRFRQGAPVLETPELVRAFLTIQLAPLDFEVFAVLLLDAGRCLIDYLELFRGTTTGTTV